MARGELHIQLSVDYADDEKFADVSRSARLLYVDALCMAKRLLNDGTVTRAQLAKLMWPVTAAAAKKAAVELTDSGLWLWDEERRVYVISAWLKRNKSRAQITQERIAAEEAALLGNHKRWHVGRGERDEGCKFCLADEPKSGHGKVTAAQKDLDTDLTEGESGSVSNANRSGRARSRSEVESPNSRGRPATDSDDASSEAVKIP